MDNLKEILKMTRGELKLNGSSLNADDISVLAQGLEGNTSVTGLNLNNNNIRIEGANALAPILSRNYEITSLDIGTNHIKLERDSPIVNSLKNYFNINTLNLENNTLGPEGARILADILANNHSITTLNLDQNFIGLEGLEPLVDALLRNNTVKVLNLTRNFSEQERRRCVDLLAVLLARSTSITTLKIVYSNFSYDEMVELVRASNDNPNMTTLNLSINHLTADQKSNLRGQSERVNIIV